MVGVAARPQAGLVLPGRASPTDTTGAIYDTGNLVIFWMGIPALMFAGIAAWRRRSLSLTVVVLLFVAMWLPWARIDRATFQYHYYTSVPFVVLALAYLLAELWHGPAKVAWLLARVGAAACILGAPLLWLVRTPLCLAANTEAVNANSEACRAVSRGVSQQTLAVLVVLAIATTLVVWQLWRAERHTRSADGDRRTGTRNGLILTGTITLLAVAACMVLFDDQHRTDFAVSADALALVGLLVLAGPAWLVLRARDARRFAAGVVISAGLWLLLWYPNLTGLPIPSGLVNVHQGLLPTWNYAFQFAVNLDPPIKGGLIDTVTLVLALVTLLGVVAVMLMARRWRSHPPAALLADLDTDL